MENLLKTLSVQLGDAVERAGGSVVQVAGPGWGSACGISIGRGRVLTNEEDGSHEGLTVRTAEGASHSAVHGGFDPATGIALVRADGLEAEAATPAASLPRPGDLVLALGRGFSGTLVAAAGIVSSVGGPLRTGAGASIPEVIRTDITPYGGFTGGALIDAGGLVAGLITGARLRGLAMAIPASTAWKVADALSEHGRMRRGYLGVSSHPVRIPDRQRGDKPGRGLLIAGVGSGTPADEAGILVGDLLVEFDGSPVAHPAQLMDLLAGERAGALVKAGILRGGKFEVVEVRIGDRP